MGLPLIVSVYLIFFLSGAAALIYEVLWVRYLTLIFGGSHLAVATVLTVFMGGLALGSYLIGKRLGRVRKLLRLYGFLELGIALSALLFVGFMNFYPNIYIPLAQLNENSVLYLTIIRLCLAVIALIVPTTLMGGTLPLLADFISQQMSGLGVRLSFLYGINTLGAVTGTALTGLYFLVHYSVNTTLGIAIFINIAVGLVALALQTRVQPPLPGELGGACDAASDAYHSDVDLSSKAIDSFPVKLVLWGIGVSGFCALAYEVLWTRILSIVIGASTYGFTILLMAFLAGIALGSAAYGLFLKLIGASREGEAVHPGRSVGLFGLVQVLIGVSALLVSWKIRNLPAYSVAANDLLKGLHLDIDYFAAKNLADFTLAFSFMFIPAFFMGVAFPLAGKIHSYHKKSVGYAVGEVLSFNTIGAILGSAVSGFLLIYLFGIQRALQIIVLINIGYGLLVMASIRGNRLLNKLVSGAAFFTLLIPVLLPNAWVMWDPRIYAIYQANIPDQFKTEKQINEALSKNDIKYYAEGVNSIVSAVQSGRSLFFVTNGRVEASNSNEGMQCQYALGHLPMLLHRNPKSVFVLGTGSGMTLGATTVHPTVEKVTLAEIEPKVLGVARAFGVYNHYVLDKPNPKLKIVFNDGRNFLMTTKEKFDVITADPVHPWFSGAGYLYTSEYFKIAAEHLNPGGIICQWLPLYELTAENLQSVVKTLRQHFKYTMIWVTHDDAELIGSNSPILIDETDLDRRIRVPEILRDLASVKMGTAEDFLSYYVMGSEGAMAYSDPGKVNTDNNLYLEFSAPRNIGMAQLLATNMADLLRYRESLIPYLASAENGAEAIRQKERWDRNQMAAVLNDRAHVLFLAGDVDSPEYLNLMAQLQIEFLDYAPAKYLRKEEADSSGKLVGQPILLKQLVMEMINKSGVSAGFDFSAVLFRTDTGMKKVFFIDNKSQFVFGILTVDGEKKDQTIYSFVEELSREIAAFYNEELKSAVSRGSQLPNETRLFPAIKNLVESRVYQSL